jgi:hypothetical protein
MRGKYKRENRRGYLTLLNEYVKEQNKKQREAQARR